MLSEPAKREHVHARSIDLKGYRRDDGLMEVEGVMTDVKTYDFANRERGTIHAGEPIHHMQVRITFDDSLEIVAAEAATLAGPYAICPAATKVFDRLVGLTIGPGWRNKVRQAIGGVEGCTHITELMGPVATVAYQTLFGEKSRRRRELGEDPDETKTASLPVANTCIGHAEDPEAVLAGTWRKGQGAGPAK